MKESNQTNIHGRQLESCSQDPVTGFFRNGCCDTDKTDRGLHTVCVILTEEFLDFSKLEEMIYQHRDRNMISRA